MRFYLFSNGGWECQLTMGAGSVRFGVLAPTGLLLFASIWSAIIISCYYYWRWMHSNFIAVLGN